MDLDRAYANGAFIPGSESLPAQWAADAAAFRDQLAGRAKLDLSYGPEARQKFDLFLPESAPRGLLIFVHGGYWLAFGRESWSHFAAGALARGYACAIPSYTLAPQARISEMTAEIDAAVCAAARMIDGPVVVTGHSAGGHLSARMGCDDRQRLVAARVVRVVPISPVAELAPLMQTKMNNDLRLTDAEAQTESPARRTLRAGCEAHVWVGGQERPAFLWQARTLSEEWGCPWTVDPDRHHFNVIEPLTDPNSSLIAACLEGMKLI